MEALLSNRQIKFLKGKGQLLDPVLKIGKNGVTQAFLESVEQALQLHELIKIKFDSFKTEKKVLAPQIADKTSSKLVMQVGNVMVLFRENSNPKLRKIHFNNEDDLKGAAETD